TDAVDVTINTIPTVDLGNDVTQCGGTATLDAANAGADFEWSDNSTNQTLAVTATGTYAVTVTDANTCTATDEVDVTINTIPTVDLGNDITQCGGSATLDAANAGADFEWSDNSNNQTLAVTATGTYSVTVTDANTCTATDEVDITINTIPTVDLGNDITQCGGSATLDAANAGADFEWSDNSANQTLAVTATGTYSVTVTDANSCTATDEVDVTINTIPTVTLGSFITVCVGAADVTLSGGAPAGGIYSGTGVTGGVFDPSAGTQTITYTYTDVNTCSATATQTFTVDQCLDIAQTEENTVNCFPNPATNLLTVTVSSIQSNLTVRILDVTGKLVANDEQYNVSGAYYKVFDIANFTQGVYVVEIHNGNAFSTKRISKQ
ncbi:MAG TPA: T9SS type A sorting domain-containing protein, partial [Chitinophagales bacterium]|nr:T9SS type A sorting domain-containing protein [Chitinophagales bacterium]